MAICWAPAYPMEVLRLIPAKSLRQGWVALCIVFRPRIGVKILPFPGAERSPITPKHSPPCLCSALPPPSSLTLDGDFYDSNHSVCWSGLFQWLVKLCLFINLRYSYPTLPFLWELDKNKDSKRKLTTVHKNKVRQNILQFFFPPFLQPRSRLRRPKKPKVEEMFLCSKPSLSFSSPFKSHFTSQESAYLIGKNLLSWLLFNYAWKHMTNIPSVGWRNIPIQPMTALLPTPTTVWYCYFTNYILCYKRFCWSLEDTNPTN